MAARVPGDRYEQLFALSPEPLCVLDQGGRFLRMNPAWERILGFLAEELVSTPLLALVHEEDKDAAQEALDELSAPPSDGAPRRFICRMRCKDAGAYRWLAWSASALPQSREGQIIASAQDVTEQHRELRRFKALLDATPDFVGLSRMNGEMLYINPAGFELLGRTGQDAASIRHRDLVPPTEYERLVRDVLPALMIEGVWSGESELLAANGEAIPVMRYTVRLWDERGQADGFGTVAIDLRQKRRDEADMRRIKALLETTTDFVGLADLTGSLLYVNPPGMALVGRAGEDYSGDKITFIADPESAAPADRGIRAALMERGIWTGERALAHKEGAFVPVSQAVMLLRDEAGAPEAVATIARDLRMHKRMEESLREAIRALGAPILEIGDGVLALPVIGRVDAERSARMMEALLRAIVEARGRVAVLDLTGVTEIDGATIEHLLRMVAAAALLGTSCLVSGVAPGVARAIVDLDLDAAGLRAYRTLEEALRAARGARRARS